MKKAFGLLVSNDPGIGTVKQPAQNQAAKKLGPLLQRDCLEAHELLPPKPLFWVNDDNTIPLWRTTLWTHEEIIQWLAETGEPYPRELRDEIQPRIDQLKSSQHAKRAQPPPPPLPTRWTERSAAKQPVQKLQADTPQDPKGTQSTPQQVELTVLGESLVRDANTPPDLLLQVSSMVQKATQMLVGANNGYLVETMVPKDREKSGRKWAKPLLAKCSLPFAAHGEHDFGLPAAKIRCHAMCLAKVKKIPGDESSIVGQGI